MKNLKVGQRVFVSPELNSVWTGEGEITFLYVDEKIALVKMLTGGLVGETGGFEYDRLEPAGLKILAIKRSTQKTGLKIYGKVQGERGKTYNFAYIRRPNFRGWICSCENFFFEMFKKSRNCKHLHFVRGEVGRFGSKVPKTAN